MLSLVNRLLAVASYLADNYKSGAILIYLSARKQMHIFSKMSNYSFFCCCVFFKHPKQKVRQEGAFLQFQFVLLLYLKTLPSNLRFMCESGGKTKRNYLQHTKNKLQQCHNYKLTVLHRKIDHY